jgi:hypothetical protein
VSPEVPLTQLSWGSGRYETRVKSRRDTAGLFAKGLGKGTRPHRCWLKNGPKGALEVGNPE